MRRVLCYLMSLFCSKGFWNENTGGDSFWESKCEPSDFEWCLFLWKRKSQTRAKKMLRRKREDDSRKPSDTSLKSSTSICEKESVQSEALLTNIFFNDSKEQFVSDVFETITLIGAIDNRENNSLSQSAFHWRKLFAFSFFFLISRHYSQPQTPKIRDGRSFSKQKEEWTQNLWLISTTRLTTEWVGNDQWPSMASPCGLGS